MSELDRELDKVRRKQDAAMGEKASQGSTREGVLDAGVRAALDHAVENLQPDFGNLEKALGEKLDAGSFLMGMQCAALAYQGVDANAAVKAAGPLFREYIAKAREQR